VTVEIRSQHPRARGLAARLRARAALHLEALGRAGQPLSLLLTGDPQMRALNRRWRGLDRATDVLSFPLHDPPGSQAELGDVAISLDTAARRARQRGRPLLDEVDRYLVHGILHLVGHDHHRPAQARAMAAAEARLLGDPGLVGHAHGERATGAPRPPGRASRDPTRAPRRRAGPARPTATRPPSAKRPAGRASPRAVR